MPTRAVAPFTGSCSDRVCVVMMFGSDFLYRCPRASRESSTHSGQKLTLFSQWASEKTLTASSDPGGMQTYVCVGIQLYLCFEGLYLLRYPHSRPFPRLPAHLFGKVAWMTCMPRLGRSEGVAFWAAASICCGRANEMEVSGVNIYLKKEWLWRVLVFFETNGC